MFRFGKPCAAALVAVTLATAGFAMSVPAARADANSGVTLVGSFESSVTFRSHDPAAPANTDYSDWPTSSSGYLDGFVQGSLGKTHLDYNVTGTPPGIEDPGSVDATVTWYGVTTDINGHMALSPGYTYGYGLVVKSVSASSVEIEPTYCYDANSAGPVFAAIGMVLPWIPIGDVPYAVTAGFNIAGIGLNMLASPQYECRAMADVFVPLHFLNGHTFVPPTPVSLNDTYEYIATPSPWCHTYAWCYVTDHQNLTIQSDYSITNATSMSSGPYGTTTYHPITPFRLVDSRLGKGLNKLVSHVAQPIQVAGMPYPYPAVPADAVAVTGNLTITGQTAAGWAELGPTALNYPVTSTINFGAAGDNRANNVTIPLNDEGGMAIVYGGPWASTVQSRATTQAIFDVTGYFTMDGSGATYKSIPPVKAFDTRYGMNGGSLVANTPRVFTLAGTSGIPSSATAVTGNLTEFSSTAAGWINVGPTGTSAPTVSTMNLAKGDQRDNGVTATLTGGQLTFYYGAVAGNTVDVIFEVTGYYVPGLSYSRFVPINPIRVVDTRSPLGIAGPLAQGAVHYFTPTTSSYAVWTGPGPALPPTAPTPRPLQIPSSATALAGNLTGTNQTGSSGSRGYLYMGASSTEYLTVASDGFAVGDIKANGVCPALTASGSVYLMFGGTSGTSSQAVFDIDGYFKTGS